MQVYLKYPQKNSNENFDNFLILEFQGKIESTADELDGLKLGDLIKNNEKSYSINIGNHILDGTKIKLSMPILVSENLGTSNENERELRIIGICREKILFNKRPTPIFDAKLKKIKESNSENIFFNARKK